ncbi:G protein-coupled receptor, rhodopsin-like family and GPCR, rhodopsin-like, 7TM domain and 7TM GPCR, olfactory receptor/chemoreceptor Srsx family-containing protein [Strongyloides ratti]|uniref:G protein-coupled receptor, rhodopsin-like family and GPCR, rhodopsin-like, 7TM domain and 7TM GPCR, olfactory receptor/chemoreceptor Srsx family-containing protein n=1 Tax=Strongyloides ratti TaxID=34506 RepID=A0A090LK63_STRRB|nr:G protein-coupled receptor, rhodopsin-like family and GPCR, rhodopsin-like, 7TM domain and 7TM GPCR, olfactory receptor/chemoreceptor Srsx family-containing protein [Strongyloides ratti]CEF70103.1 G protein-coupled receptor, rhodopsin-like family and GPCR, rhodopsin-like, 7TM domain and 7TM GPCR, olfactory receptor/chemoreceptor Srsx family-containing protein [Strongyloides ratti]
MLHPIQIKNASLQGSTGIICVISNLIIVYIALKSKRFLRTFTNFTIFQLSVADLIFGLGAMMRVYNDIWPILRNVDSSISLEICTLLLTPHTFGYQLRQFTVIFIALDRLAAIKWPFAFKNTSHTKKIFVTFGASFLYASITIAIGWLTREPLSSKTRCVFITFITLYLQILSWFESHRRDKETVNFKRTTINVNDNHIVQKYVSDYAKVKKTISLVMLNYIAFWAIPQIVFLIFLIISQNNEVASEVMAYQNYLNALHSCLNLIIYLSTYSEIKRLFSKHILMRDIDSSTTGGGNMRIRVNRTKNTTIQNSKQTNVT